MKLFKVRGGNADEVYNRRYNIGIGISLGNKWFSLENIMLLVEWSLKYTKEYVVVYVADSIHAINIEVRQHKSKEASQVIADHLGQEILLEVETIAKQKIMSTQQKMIYYAQWDTLRTTEFQSKVSYMYHKYETDSYFHKRIEDLIVTFTENELKHFTPLEIEKLGTYLLEELPELLNRVPINGRVVDAYAYPFDSELLEIVESIQQGNLFPEIKKDIMDTEPKVFLEVR